METVFLRLVNLSIAASWLVLAVAALRLLFRKAPRWIFCLLWGLVGLRLLCPLSIESALSLVPSAQTLPPEILYTAAPQIQSGIGVVNAAVNPLLREALAPAPWASANPTQIWSFVLSRIWLAGVAAMALYAAVSCLLLRRRVRTATLLRENIKQSERVASPFVLGLFRPVVYLPYSIPEQDLEYVLAHERAHIQRRDHWWKFLGFALLSVYWFCPLLWAAYILLGRDIEMACDEKVIRGMGMEGRRGYSAALLHCGVRRRAVAACPLAFGEVGIKARIKAVMNYKKPAFWLVAAALAACCAAAVCFLTDPVAPLPTPAGKAYTYEKEGIGGDFTITVREDGTFTYSEGPLSSYLGVGTWSVSGDRLTLTEQAGADAVNHFRMDGEDLFYIQKGSANFMFVEAEDGDVFRGSPMAEGDSSGPAVIKWFDYTSSPSQMDWDAVLTAELPQFPGVTFRYVPEQITSQKGEEEPVVLIMGMPIHNAYFCDLTGDGFPDICACLSMGSGMIDSRVVLYDCAEGALHTLQDRGSYNYSLRYNEDDGFLYVDKETYRQGAVVSSGRLAYANGGIQILEASQGEAA